uniref:Ras-related protein Rab n=1 Tax=Amorphochlora amoebiformis TaxID=1561963 RepID=A0A7S0CXN5_9EUKA
MSADLDDVLDFDPSKFDDDEIEKLEKELANDTNMAQDLQDLGVDLDIDGLDDVPAATDQATEAKETPAGAVTEPPEPAPLIMKQEAAGISDPEAKMTREELLAKMKALQAEHEVIKKALESDKKARMKTPLSEVKNIPQARHSVHAPESSFKPEMSTPERPTRRSVDSASKQTPTPQRRGRKRAIKVIVVGNSKCGKTSIINRYVKNVFSNEYNYTIGCEYSKKEVEVTPEITVRLQLWDIAGQDRFIHLSRAFYKKSAGAILVWDVTRPATMEALRGWKKEIDKDLIEEAKRKGSKVPVIMIANKVDLLPGVSKSIEVGAQAQELAEELDLDGWFIGSAKLDDNISEAMMFLLKKIVGVGQENSAQPQMTTPGGSFLDEKPSERVVAPISSISKAFETPIKREPEAKKENSAPPTTSGEDVPKTESVQDDTEVSKDVDNGIKSKTSKRKFKKGKKDKKDKECSMM